MLPNTPDRIKEHTKDAPILEWIETKYAPSGPTKYVLRWVQPNVYEFKDSFIL